VSYTTPVVEVEKAGLNNNRYNRYTAVPINTPSHPPPSHPPVPAVRDMWQWERWPGSNGYFGMKCVLCDQFEQDGNHCTSNKHKRKAGYTENLNANYTVGEIQSLYVKLNYNLAYHEDHVEHVLGRRPDFVSRQEMEYVHEKLFTTRPAVAAPPVAAPPPPPVVQVPPAVVQVPPAVVQVEEEDEKPCTRFTRNRWSRLSRVRN
jgi:hypothetical protein